MRSFHAAVLWGLLTAGITTSPAGASGNVLLPSNNNPSNLPNLGLSPETPNSQPPANSPAPAPTPSPAVLPQMQMEDSGTGKSTMNLPYTPVPTGTAPPQMADMQASMAAAMKTQVMKMPDNSAVFQPAARDLPNSVTLETDAKWGTSDIQKVSGQFGISAGQVPSACKISIRVFVISDKGSFPSSYDAGSSPRAAVKYDGKMTMVSLAKTALCNTSIQLPPNKGMIIQIGDYYMLALGGGTCQIPSDKPVPGKIVFSPGQYGLLQCSF